jgi:hypothetical protein
MSLAGGICGALVVIGMGHLGCVAAILREASARRRSEIEDTSSWRSAATPSTINHLGLDPLEDIQGLGECRETVLAGGCSPNSDNSDSTGWDPDSVSSSREGREIPPPSAPGDDRVFSSPVVRVFPSQTPERSA